MYCHGGVHHLSSESILLKSCEMEDQGLELSIGETLSVGQSRDTRVSSLIVALSLFITTVR